MKLRKRFLLAAVAPLAAVMLPPTLHALDGAPQIHDPSTVVESNGKWYTYGTGGAPLVSDDGWTWRRGTTPSRTGAAPDVIHVGDRYYMYISGVTMIWSKSLDPNSPDYKWEDGGRIAGNDTPEVDVNPIDPGAFLDPTTGKLWLTYGSYVGYTQIVELDPKTGQRVQPPQKPVNLAINCEASDMIYHDGWYYLLATHASCCANTDSGYQIRMGRSKSPTGPFIDNMGVDMIQGGGKLFATSSGRAVGPGHFGRIDLGDGVEKWSSHSEADLDRGGASVLEIRPLLWKDGWPAPGDNFKAGTYQMESVRNGRVLELAVQAVQVGGARGGRGGGGGGRAGGGGGPIPDQEASQVSQNWPAGNVDVRMSNFMLQAQQKWSIAPAPDAGGYLGSPYFKITVAGTNRALAATAGGELVVVPEFKGGPEQLWRIDQLTDGTYRIMPKTVPDSKEQLCLSAVGSGAATLTKFDPKSEKQRWNLKAP